MKRLIPFVNIFTTLTVVFFVILTVIRMLFSPYSLEIEYRMPGFPADAYGFTFEQRLEWARVSLRYLLNDSDISYFDNLKLDNGEPLYNERELQHMDDVKLWLRRLITTWYITIALLILFGLFANEFGFSVKFWRAFVRGGWLTLAITLTVFLGIALSFDLVFTGFHQIFFKGDSWLFSYSDTFIRLFPIRFWQDAFIAAGLLCLIGSISVVLIGKVLIKKKSQAELASEK